jgi:hypothetical protein
MAPAPEPADRVTAPRKTLLIVYHTMTGGTLFNCR